MIFTTTVILGLIMFLFIVLYLMILIWIMYDTSKREIRNLKSFIIKKKMMQQYAEEEELNNNINRMLRQLEVRR